LVDLKSASITWDKGFSDNNEWVYISKETSEHEDIFNAWLSSKDIDPENECIIFNDSFSESSSTVWKKLESQNPKIFNQKNIYVYDIDIKWVLEIPSLGVARFGRFN